MPDLEVIVEMPEVKKKVDPRKGTYLTEWNDVMGNMYYETVTPNPIAPPILDFELPGDWKQTHHQVFDDYGYKHLYQFKGTTPSDFKIKDMLMTFFQSKRDPELPERIDSYTITEYLTQNLNNNSNIGGKRRKGTRKGRKALRRRRNTHRHRRRN